MMLRSALFGMTLLVLGGGAAQADLWDKVKTVTGHTIDAVGETAKDIGSAVAGEKEDAAVVRGRLDRAAADGIERLIARDPTARERFERAAGYAVFDTRKHSLLITTGFGSGVVVDKTTGRRVYMKMATGGVNVGYGIQIFQVIFLFPDRSSLTSFVEQGWTADVSASAAADADAAGGALRLESGVYVYRQDERGAALSLALTGSRYWRSDELN